MRRLLVISLLLAATPVQAQWLTGNQLHDWCKQPATDVMCLAYVVGVMDGTSANTPSLEVPQGVTRGQLTDVVKKYLQDHPENRNLPGWQVVALAVISAWPSANRPK